MNKADVTFEDNLQLLGFILNMIAQKQPFEVERMWLGGQMLWILSGRKDIVEGILNQ